MTTDLAKNNRPCTLGLRRETLRILTAVELRQVAGGGGSFGGGFGGGGTSRQGGTT